MLRMSKLADYAFVILSHMASNKRSVWSASLLSQETSLPLPTVAKLMKMLAKNKIVEAKRGATGGYCLTNNVKDTTIAMIIEAVDGPISLTQCAGMVVGDECDCAVEKECPIRNRWGYVNSVIKKSLETVSLFDLLPDTPSV